MKNLFRVPFAVFLLSIFIVSCSKDNLNNNDDLSTNISNSSLERGGKELGHMNTAKNREAILAAIPKIEFEYEATHEKKIKEKYSKREKKLKKLQEINKSRTFTFVLSAQDPLFIKACF